MVQHQLVIYLELACHDEQNRSQTFKIRARIAKLWQFNPLSRMIFYELKI